MRSSAVLALAFAAAASPAFAAPLASPATRNFARAESTASSSSDVSSEAAIKLGTIANIAGFAAPVIGGIIDHFKNKGNQKQRRDAMEVEALLARGEIDESEAAIKLGTIANIAGFAAPVIGGIIDHFRNKDKPKREDFEELFARADEDSEAVKLGTVANVAGIASNVVNVWHTLFGGQKREDIESLFARDDESAALALSLLGHLPRLPMGHGPVVRTRDVPADDSEAIKLGTVANIASIGSSVVSAFHSLFGRDGQGEFLDLLARAELSDDDSGAIVLRPGMQPIRIPPGLAGHIRIGRDVADQDSEAVRLNTIATIAGIGSNVVNVWHTLFGGNKKRSDELMELLARSDDPDSEAIRLSTIGKIASIGSSLVSVVHGLFGGQQKRELIEFLARAETTDESDAIKLGTIANIAGIGSSVVSVFHNLFGGNQKREFEELMARAADDEAAAVKLSTLGNIASIGGSVISAIHNLFSSNNQNKKREFMELLARASADETGVDSSEAAIKLGTIANIAGFAAPVIGGIIDHFRNKDKPKREDIESLIARELTARAAAEGIDESDAISLKTIGTIASFAAPLVGGIVSHFTNKDKPKREDFEDLFARELIARAADDESDAISLKTVGTIASFAAPVIGGIIDHFTNKGKRDFEDILFQARSLNDLD